MPPAAAGTHVPGNKKQESTLSMKRFEGAEYFFSGSNTNLLDCPTFSCDHLSSDLSF
jgi:hypothetical protein